MALKGDFIGFTFNGRHSSELGIIRTSDGSRYNSELLPSFNDNTVTVPGRDETYYFGSYYNQKTFPIQFATDELSEVQFRQLRQWLGDKGIHDLIFDEAPYKVYSAKIAAVPNFNYICFDKGIDDSERVYKGEGTIQFVCYYPYARSVWKGLNLVPNTITNKNEWAAASRIPATAPTLSGADITLWNPGDLETDINIITTATSGLTFSLNGNIKLSLNDITHENGDAKIRINSSTHLIEGLDNNNVPTGKLYNKYILSGDFFKIPLNTYLNNEWQGTRLTGPEMIVEYDYLYY